MEVKEVEKKKYYLRQEIERLIKEFQDETGLAVNSLRMASLETFGNVPDVSVEIDVRI